MSILGIFPLQSHITDKKLAGTAGMGLFTAFENGWEIY
jgi:hypothetical protein